jgi:hypothetical protein
MRCATLLRRSSKRLIEQHLTRSTHPERAVSERRARQYERVRLACDALVAVALVALSLVALVGCDPAVDLTIVNRCESDLWVRVESTPHWLRGQFRGCSLLGSRFAELRPEPAQPWDGPPAAEGRSRPEPSLDVTRGSSYREPRAHNQRRRNDG